MLCLKLHLLIYRFLLSAKLVHRVVEALHAGVHALIHATHFVVLLRFRRNLSVLLMQVVLLDVILLGIKMALI